MNKKKLTPQNEASSVRTSDVHYTSPRTTALALARLADELTRAEHWAVHTPADAALLRRFMAEYRSALEVSKDSPDAAGLWDACRSLADDIVSRLITGRVELKGVTR